jgi:hypothetical protein
MGKRSRKRTGSSGGAATSASAAGTTRAERDAARARRAAAVRETSAAPGERRPARRSPRGERPPAPWGSFPLVELCVLLALVLLVGGFITGGKRGATMILAGLALGSLGGLELTIREHFAGYRSHTTLLAGAIALFVGTLVAVVAGKVLLPILLGLFVLVFLSFFVVFRRAFKKASGGLSFR